MRDLAAAEAQLNGVARWRQIADNLEQAIVHGEFPLGARLPAEVEIAERFGVNRHTVRRALAELSERGLVRPQRGSGTYVESKRLAYPIGARTRFSEIVGNAGRQPGGRLIAGTLEPVVGAVANRLALLPGAPVARLELLRSADRIPLCSSTIWIPTDRVPDAVRLYRRTQAITPLLHAAGIRDYRRQSTHVSAGIADAADARRLRLAPGRPLLVIDAVDVAPDGVPILTSRARFAADRVELVIENS
jgi:GntR family phosphonate transport system transcriptional regulator